MVVVEVEVTVVTVLVLGGGCCGKRHCGLTAPRSAERTRAVRKAARMPPLPASLAAAAMAVSEPSRPTTCKWLCTSEALATHDLK